MKLISICIFLLNFSSALSWACSEAGPHDFDISSTVQKACAENAKIYAANFAETMEKVERQSGAEIPRGKFKYEGAVLYKTQKSPGDSNLIGFNVSLKSRNGWECNFCVDMQADKENHCTIRSVYKHMCAK